MSPLFPQIATFYLGVAMSCVFCDIIHGNVPAEIIFENDRAIVFKDHWPKAPTHLLVCPKTHYATFLETQSEEFDYLLKVCRRLAETLRVQDGFRIMVNNGPQSGQIVFHLHLHFLAWGHRQGEAKITLGEL